MAELVGRAKAERAFNNLKTRQAPFFLSRVMNETMKAAKAAEERQITRAFNNPKAFTRRSVFIRFSNKRNLIAEIGIKDIQRKYLTPQEIGGGRRYTRFEARLFLAGVLEPGEYVVPSGDVKITRGVFTQILSQTGALREGSATNSKRSQRARKRAGAYFVTGEPGVGRGQGLPRGIWRRKGIFIEPVFWITRKTPTYRPILRFEDTGESVIRKAIPGIAGKHVGLLTNR